MKKKGYHTKLTQATGDQGADVLASKGQEKWALQVKCYSNAVGNSSVQEAIAARTYYGCSHAAVVTNSTFTKSAQELAQIANVQLIDRGALINIAAEVGVTLK